MRHILFVLLISALLYPAITSVRLVDSLSNTVDLEYDLYAQGYGDGLGDNPDVTVEACGDVLSDVQNQYVMLVYHVGAASNDYINVAHEPTSNYTQLTDCSGTCCRGSFSFDVDPSWAKYPGILYAIVSSDTTFDSSDTFVLVNNSLAGSVAYIFDPGPFTPFSSFGGFCEMNPVAYGMLDPDYGVSEVNGKSTLYYVPSPRLDHGVYCYPEIIERGYDRFAGQLDIDVDEFLSVDSSPVERIIYQSMDAYFGACGEATSSDHWSCVDVQRVNSPFVSLSYGLIPADDSQKFYTYLVFNGIGCKFCIGANPGIYDVTSEDYYDVDTFAFGPPSPPSDIANPPPSSINYGSYRVFLIPQDMDLVLHINLSNMGNYPFTNPVQINLTVNDSLGIIYSAQVQYTGGLSEYNSTVFDVTVPHTIFPAVGEYNLTVVLDPLSVANCYLYDDIGFVDRYVINVTDPILLHPYVQVNDQHTLIFNESCRPYDLSVFVQDPNGNSVQGVGVRVLQRNGISLFAPVQKIETSTLRGLSSLDVGEITTDSNGYANFTIIPTGNEFYTDYSYLNMDDYVGNYSIYIELYNVSTGELLEFDNGTATSYRLYLNLTNLTCTTPDALEEHSYSHPFSTEFQQVVQFMYNVFASVYRWLA